MDYQGLLICSRYAFPPNSLSYCGPDKISDLYGYVLKKEEPNKGLAEIVKEFQTLFPYLKLIASENNIKNPFDRRVVEAYWIGNPLLRKVSMKNLYRHFTESLGLPKKMKKKDVEILMGKIPQGAIAHHTFHVFNIFKRTGRLGIEHTLETMDKCRIGWGKVVSKPVTNYELQVTKLKILTKPLVLKEGKLALGKPITKTISFPFSDDRQLTIDYLNRWVSFHWDFFCDLLTRRQVENLEKYTLWSIKLANTTI